MARMTLNEIQAVVASYVAAAKQAGTWSASTNNLIGLVDKIAKTITIDGLFTDKLAVLDGEELPLGKTIEEFYQDLGTIQAYNDYKSDPSNAAQNALKPYYPSYEDCAYSYTLGRKVLPTTLKYNEYERACNDASELTVITNLVLKRLYDTFAMFKYDSKKQIIANCIAKAEAQQAVATAITWSTTTAAVKGTRYKSGNDVAIAVKAATSGKTWAQAIAAGILVKFNLIEQLAFPSDTSKGEAFIESVKKAAESAEFASEGNAINGSSIGAAEGLLLIVKKGVRPALDVQTYAGAFNPEKLAVPAEIIVVDDFGDNATNAYAVLVDKRALRLHPTYMAVREQVNGEGDYVNYFLHTENTAFISKNCFVHVWEANI